MKETFEKAKTFWNQNKKTIKRVAIGGAIIYLIGFGRGCITTSSITASKQADFPEEMDWAFWFIRNGYTKDQVERVMEFLENAPESLDVIFDVLEKKGFEVGHF